VSLPVGPAWLSAWLPSAVPPVCVPARLPGPGCPPRLPSARPGRPCARPSAVSTWSACQPNLSCNNCAAHRAGAHTHRRHSRERRGSAYLSELMW